jgi:beta-N-acetylhexosaminidase
VDLEGGRVNRFDHLIGPFPPPAAWAARSKTAGQVLGCLCRSLGIDLTFAPVVDLEQGGTTNGLEERLMGARPDGVAASAMAFLQGLHDQGIHGCLKHFPGLGSTQVDSHFHMPTLALSQEDWQQNDFRVYQILARSGFSQTGIMLAHCRVPFWEGENAGGSRHAFRLLDALGFRGPRFSDDLDMGALKEQGALEEVVDVMLDLGMTALLACRNRDHQTLVFERWQQKGAPRAVYPFKRMPPPPGPAPTIEEACEAYARFCLDY